MRSHATTADHLALAPPAGGHWAAPAGLAVGVHVLLALALAWGVNWRDDTPLTAVSAELWSRLPQEAAPQAVAPPPPPPPAPEASTPPPPPAPAPQVQALENADIALRQREKAQREQEAARRLEQARKENLAKEKAAKEKAAQAEKDKAKAEQARQQAEQKKQQIAQQKAEAEKRQRDEAARKKAAQAAIDRNREEQIQRQMAQLGGATGSGGSGQVARSSGPSAGYASRVAARIRPNIRFYADLPSNPAVEVRVRAAPDGTILARSVHKSSGNTAWDQAALRAIDLTAALPRDNDGRVPSDLIIELRPKAQ